MARISLRPAGFDELGLKRALSDRMLPSLVAAMAFLAALALAGWVGAAALAHHWREGAGSALTVQVPRPKARSTQDGVTRLAGVMTLLTATPGIVSARALPDEELADMLRPWLGTGTERISVPLPAVIAVRVSGPVDLSPLSKRLDAAAPGTLLEDHGLWVRRLSVLAWSLQACSGMALLLVAGIAATVIAVATRAGLAVRREAIEIVHGLGATDGYIAGRFARRATLLAAAGAVIGAVAASPVLVMLARLAAPIGGATVAPTTAGETLAMLPPPLWLGLAGLPVAAALIGFVTAQGTVRRWLRRLP